MLIVTIPKSAGTALMETLARAQGIPCTMHYRWDGPRSAEFPTFHIQHNFDRELAPGHGRVAQARVEGGGEAEGDADLVDQRGDPVGRQVEPDAERLEHVGRPRL